MACSEAPGLVIEKQRLATIGSGLFLGIVGDSRHSFGYHLCDPPSGDYSLSGAANKPVGRYACALDISMNWPAARQWLAWLITEIREDRITGIAEVIGSFDGRNVRYWSDSETPQWQQEGVPYNGDGHDTWTHVAIYRSSAQIDHGLLAGWNASGYRTPSPTPGGNPVANQYDGIKDVVLMNGPPGGTRLGDVWGRTLGNAESAKVAAQAAAQGVSDLLARPTTVAIELRPQDVEVIAAQVAARVTDTVAQAVVDKLIARLV